MKRALIFILWVSALSCGPQPRRSFQLREVELGPSPTDTLLLRAAWWKVISGDYSGSKTLFMKTKDNPWSRLGLAHVARLNLDHSRTETLLKPLLAKKTFAGELARYWSQEEYNSPWQSVKIKGRRGRQDIYPTVTLSTADRHLLSLQNWLTLASPNDGPRQCIEGLNLIHDSYKTRKSTRCIRIDTRRRIALFDEQKEVVFLSPKRHYLTASSRLRRFDIIKTDIRDVDVHEIDVPCAKITQLPSGFLEADEDELVAHFFEREFSLLIHERIPYFLPPLGPNTHSIEVFALQTLIGISSGDAHWNVKRIDLLNALPPNDSARFVLERTRALAAVGRHEDAWRHLKPLIGGSNSHRDVWAFGVETLSALDRSSEARALAREYLNTGAPICRHAKVIYGALGERSDTIEEIIDTDIRCGNPENAAIRALRWHRLSRAKELENSLTDSFEHKRLKAKIWAALGDLGKIRAQSESLSYGDRVNYLADIDESQLGLVTLTKLIADAPGEPVSMQLGSWMRSHAMDITNGITPYRDHETARVTLLNREIRISSEGLGYVFHRELIRINHILAARSFAELGVPDDAELVFLQINKPDGRRVRPLRTEAKGSYTLPMLEPGDTILIEFSQPLENLGLSTMGKTEKLRIQLPYAPVDKAQITLIQPSEAQWQISTHQTQVTSTSTSDVEGHQNVSRWAFGPNERFWREPLSASTEFASGSVRLHHANFAASWIKQQAEIFAQEQQRILPLPTNICGESSWDGVKEQHLIVMLNSWLNERQNRLLSPLELSGRLSKCLLEIGVPHSVVLLAPVATKEMPISLKIDAYTHPVILIDHKIFWDPIGHQTPSKMVPFGLRGTEGILIYPFNKISQPYTIADPGLDGEHEITDVHIKKNHDDVLTGHLRFQLDGNDAFEVRRQLLGASENQTREFARNHLTQFYPLAKLEQASILTMEERNFVLEAQFRTTKTSLTSVSLIPKDLMKTMCSTPKRMTTLYIDRPVQRTVLLTIDPKVLHSKAVPITLSQGRNRLRVRWVDKTKQKLEVNLEIPRQSIPPNHYEAFEKWCSDVASYAVFRVAP